MISLQDMGLAYRKAKVDLYYSSNPSLELIANYEENLHRNLLTLMMRINSNDRSWAKSTAFIGTWTVATKSVEMPKREYHEINDEKGLIFASPAEKWAHFHSPSPGRGTPKRPTAEFRVMAECSVDFHILSALWIMKVGHLFDAKLQACAYGNRLRRSQNGKDINPYSLGSFKPYMKPFRDWRDNGIKVMRAALHEGKNIVAVTADVSSFYHKLDSSFMLDRGFISNRLNLKLDAEQSKIHQLFIRALQVWATNTPLKMGLPVGLPASAVVANMALIDLDRVIEQQVVPLYYGRYVDDILLVMENGAGFRSTGDVWEWLFERSDKMLSWVHEKKTEIAFKPLYLQNDTNESKIRFSNSKNKVFILSGDTGVALVDAIVHQIQERASEWRAMPRLPSSAGYVATNLLAAAQGDGEAADSLRKTDVLTMRRAAFAINLRDLEAYERDLPPDAWQTHRQVFLRAFTQHILVLPQFFDLAIYLPRVVRLATACEDFEQLRDIIDALDRICSQVWQDCEIKIKSFGDDGNRESIDIVSTMDIFTKWKTQLFNTVRESISAAFPPRLSKAGGEEWRRYMASYKPIFDTDLFMSWPETAKEFQKRHAKLFSCDLAHMPFRFIALPAEMMAQRGIPGKRAVTECIEAGDLLPDTILDGTKQLCRWIKLNGLPYGVLFATRPYNLPELFLLNRDLCTENGTLALKTVVKSLRGFNVEGKIPHFDKHGVLKIQDDDVPSNCGIAVSSWRTSVGSWTAAAMASPDPDIDRYSRLSRLLDGVIAEPKHSRYLVLPELAMPARWFIRIARKLNGRGISLITGIEYLHSGRARVRNQVWAALSHNGLGFPSLMIYRQDKQRPALHEELELQRLGGLRMRPEKTWIYPPIVQHGNFCFAFLVCSELTNISYRAALRGRVDALFIPEWNQDTETFNALVESAALDVHAYIIQCNDREYGDSRIRAPLRDSWKRDVLRVRGGITDYCVIGQIDIQALRQFQSSHRSPDKPFKPVPDGFEISYDRRVLPVYGAG